MSQQTFFDLEEKHHYLHVVKDAKVVHMPVKEMFNKEVYHTLKAVTFVSSPRFFFETVKEFNTVTLILGIGDGSVSGNFGIAVSKMFDVEERINVLKNLPFTIRNKIFDDKFEIRYPRNGYPVHSKIYLLEGEKTTRLILGSANFTQNGFGNDKQYEELMIFDNSPLYDVYNQRFNYIYSNTVDYIPDIIKKQREVITDMDTLLDILKDESIDLKTVVSEEQMNEIKDITHNLETESEDLRKKREIAELILKKNKKDNNYVMRTPNEIEKKKNPIRNVILKQIKDITELDNRKEFIYDDKHEQLLLSTKEDDHLKTFSAKQPREKVKEQFDLLLKFTKTFETYAVNPNADQVTKNMQRVFEVIMYSLVSPYIWRMRQDYTLHSGSRSSKRDITPFLIISGGSSSGKTTLLEFVSALLGSPNQYYSHNQIRGKKVFFSFFQSNNLHPLLSDEIPHSFFTGKIGEGIVKEIASNTEDKHPVFIGTTNADGFHTKHAVLNRIYFINFNHSFDEDKKRAGDIEKSSIFEKIDDTIFKDVSYQISQRISEESAFYKKEDMLHQVRQILLSYFTEFNIQPPSYFPQHILNDYASMASVNWKRLYEYHPQAFNFTTKDTISVNLSAINESFMSQNSKDRDYLINMLPDGTIKNNGTIIDLHKKLFLNFINKKEKNFFSFLRFWK